MQVEPHQHGHACDCAAHRAAGAGHSSAGLWSAILPILACAVCPVCLTTYAKLLSVVGIGFGLSARQHLIVLGGAVLASLGLSAWRSYRTQRVWPLALSVLGSVLIMTGHFAGDLELVEWAGVLVLLVGGLREHFRLRKLQAPLRGRAV